MSDLATIIGDLTNLVQNERIAAYNEGVDFERARLQTPFRATDDHDWKYLLSLIPDSGRGRFWKAVFAELRPLLDQTK